MIPQEKVKTTYDTSTNLDEQVKTKIDVILGRDLIFLDWTVLFGSQILGLILGFIIGFILSIDMLSIFSPGSPLNLGAYVSIQIGVLISTVGLTLYYTQKTGMKLNSPKIIANNKLNILKVAFFGLSAVFGLSFLFSYIYDWVFKNFQSAETPDGGNGGDGGDGGDGGEVPEIDLGSTNLFIGYFMAIFVTLAIYALLYAGLIYLFNKKAGIMEGAAIAIATIMLTSTLLAQGQSIISYLLEGFFMPFFTEMVFYLLLALVTVLTYHMSKRIELSILVLFVGVTLVFGAPSPIIDQLIALKFGFPNSSDGVVTAADVITQTITTLEYVGLFGIFAYPFIFFRDTIRFIIKFWNTMKFQGLGILVFTFVILTIEILISLLANVLGFLLYFIAFIILIGIVNSIITSRYGKKSYTAIFTAMSQSSLQISDPLVMPVKKQAKLYEENPLKRQTILIGIFSALPVLIYFLVSYITTAISGNTPFWTIFFFVTVAPISIGVVAFAISMFFVKNPIMKEYFSYPLKAVSIIGGGAYFFVVLSRLVNNDIGVFPILTLFFIPLIYITYRQKKSLSELLLFLAGDNRKRALKELLIRQDLNLDALEENFFKTPSYLKFWVSLVLSKKGSSTVKIELESMLKSAYPQHRAIAALALLHNRDTENTQALLQLLEEDPDPRVREAIAYGLRYYEEMEEENYKRTIDAQHYEDDAKVLSTLKETISIIDQKYANVEKEESLEFFE